LDPLDVVVRPGLEHRGIAADLGQCQRRIAVDDDQPLPGVFGQFDVVADDHGLMDAGVVEEVTDPLADLSRVTTADDAEHDDRSEVRRMTERHGHGFAVDESVDGPEPDVVQLRRSLSRWNEVRRGWPGDRMGLRHLACLSSSSVLSSPSLRVTPHTSLSAGDSPGHRHRKTTRYGQALGFTDQRRDTPTPDLAHTGLRPRPVLFDDPVFLAARAGRARN